MAYKPNLYSYGVNVSRKLVDGVDNVLRSGFNPDIDTATAPEDVWSGGGIWLPPTAARVHNIVSTDATDTAAGAGARTIKVWGLRSWNEKETSEIVTLNGLTPVPTANAYVMINLMRVETSGTVNTANAGDITATAQTDATVTAVIRAGDGQTSAAIYGWPSSQAFHFTSYSAFMAATGGSNNEIRVQAAVKYNADQPNSPFIDANETGLFAQGSSFVPFALDPPADVAGPAIIKIRVLSVSANGAAIGAGFNGYLIDKVA